MNIENEDQLIKLLESEGWVDPEAGTQFAGTNWVCPYNPKIEYNTWKCRFISEVKFKHKPKGRYNQNNTGRMIILTSISNFQDVTWVYDKQTGLLSNSLCMIRIK